MCHLVRTAALPRREHPLRERPRQPRARSWRRHRDDLAALAPLTVVVDVGVGVVASALDGQGLGRLRQAAAERHGE